MKHDAGSTLEGFQEKFRVHELLVRQFKHWYWSVRPVQSTLGASVLSLKRYAARFSDVTAEETAELAVAASLLEKTLEKAFHYDKINYLMLMMVDPHVHFHVLPRYASSRTFGGREWSDAGWPKLPVLTGEPGDQATLTAVVDELRVLLPDTHLPEEPKCKS